MYMLFWNNLHQVHSQKIGKPNNSLGAKKTPKKPKLNSHNPMIRSPMVEGD